VRQLIRIEGAPPATSALVRDDIDDAAGGERDRWRSAANASIVVCDRLSDCDGMTKTPAAE
jgi:hypothetical protein